MIVMRHEIKKSNDKFEDQIKRIHRDQQNKIKSMRDSRNLIPYLNECLALILKVPGVKEANASFGYVPNYGSIMVDVGSCMTIIDIAAMLENHGFCFDYDQLEKKPESQYVSMQVWTMPDRKGFNIGVSMRLNDGPNCKVVEYEEYEPVKKYRYECE